MTEHKIEIVVEDDVSRVQTRVTTKLSALDLMDKILELDDVE